MATLARRLRELVVAVPLAVVEQLGEPDHELADEAGVELEQLPRRGEDLEVELVEEPDRPQAVATRQLRERTGRLIDRARRRLARLEQREWLLDEVSDSRNVWTVWGNEVLTLSLRVGAGPLSVYPKQDAWDGYGAERERIMYEVAYGDVRNFVTLTGDMHSYLAGYQRLEYPDPIRQLFVDPPTDRSRRVGVELMTPAITSVNVAEAVGVDDGWLGDVTEPLLSAAVRALVPHVEFFDSHRWGYSITGPASRSAVAPSRVGRMSRCWTWRAEPAVRGPETLPAPGS